MPFPTPRLAGPLLLGLLLAVPALAGPPAAIDPAASRAEAVKVSFHRFADDWMKNLARGDRRSGAELGASGSNHRRFGRDYEVELRPTGSARAPYVGILRYKEELWSCSDAARRKCSLQRSGPVSEVFRYQDGRWVY